MRECSVVFDYFYFSPCVLGWVSQIAYWVGVSAGGFLLSFLDGFRVGIIEIGKRRGRKQREVAVQLYTASHKLVWC